MRSRTTGGRFPTLQNQDMKSDRPATKEDCQMNAPRRIAGVLMGALACLLVCAGNGYAQSYPNRPIRLIIPFAAGGAPDIVARPVAAQVEAQIGQPVVIE